MADRITQRELRNQSGDVMRRLDEGEEFVITRNGVAVGRLLPDRSRSFVRTDVALAGLRGSPAIDSERFRADVDAILDQDPTPRG